MSKAAREAGLEVALSGLGGDELFAGYSSFRTFGHAMAVGRLSRILPVGFANRAFGLDAANGMPNRTRKLVELASSGGSPGRTYAVLRGMFTAGQRRALLADGYAGANGAAAYLPAGLDELSARRALHPANAYTALELANYLRNTLLRDADAMSMAHAIEVRVPLVDHVLVEHAARIPAALKLAPGGNKPLLCRAVPGLPKSVRCRQKMGFTLPFETWFRGPLRKRMADLVLSAPAAGGLPLRREGVEGLWRAFEKGERYVSWSRVWCVAALSSWCTRHGATA